MAMNVVFEIGHVVTGHPCVQIDSWYPSLPPRLDNALIWAVTGSFSSRTLSNGTPGHEDGQGQISAPEVPSAVWRPEVAFAV